MVQVEVPREPIRHRDTEESGPLGCRNTMRRVLQRERLRGSELQESDGVPCTLPFAPDALISNESNETIRTRAPDCRDTGSGLRFKKGRDGGRGSRW